MFNFKRALIKILFLTFVILNFAKANNNVIDIQNISLQELDQKIEKIETIGQSYLDFLKNLHKTLPEIVKEINSLNNLKTKNDLLMMLLKNYGKVLKLSDLKEFSSLKDNKTLADKLILISTYTTLECIMSGIIINLEDNYLSTFDIINNDSESLLITEKIKYLNQRITYFINLIKKEKDLIKYELDNVLKNNFKIEITITANNSDKKDIMQILKALNFSEIKEFLKIKKEKLSQKIDSTLEQFCQQILHPNDIAIIKKITNSQAFIKIRNYTKTSNVESMLSITESILPPKIQTLTEQAKELLD